MLTSTDVDIARFFFSEKSNRSVDADTDIIKLFIRDGEGNRIAPILDDSEVESLQTLHLVLRKF
jgi:hypothetical protein